MSVQPSLEGMSNYRLSDRTKLVTSLADFRREWQKAVEGQSLLEVEAPVALLLADIADKLELSPQERYVMLGGKLINQVNCRLEERSFVSR